MSDRGAGLVSWQWNLYPAGHRDRRNLLLHALTVPIFELGTLALLAAPLAGPWLAPAGLAAMAGVMAVQGRTHRLETTAPVPFRGPGDVLGRILAEQWLNFPRYVATGGFARAWREAGAARTSGEAS
jgi:hypothetical protein